MLTGYLACSPLSHLSQVLYAKHGDERLASFSEALHAGDQYLRDLKAVLWYASLTKQHVVFNRQQAAGEGKKGGLQGFAQAMAQAVTGPPSPMPPQQGLSRQRSKNR